ncbi:thiamine-phosphate kinase [Arthrobacter sp. Br18]|uniref:thiamine-phosphate kinase n=1 Tax=Arthrobacter sp. Br18 TaxID=1312954 RepID=UPI00047BE248|nr:thiamine-phosphate kinase [Arthrobacter sp. Br18]
MPLTVGDLSESELLKRIFPRLPWAATTLVGPGDDAAVVAAPDGRTVLSIDTLVQDKDFRLTRPNGFLTTGYDVGWKSAAQNLSDINAMGGRATAMVVSLTLPPRTPVEWVESLADGLAAACEHLGAEGCGVVGGDLGGGTEVIVTAAVTGTLSGRAPVLRSGAKAGDVVALAGTVGRAAAGLDLLETVEDLETIREDELVLIGIQCRPEPPLGAGPAAAEAGATAMLDVSDGLVRDARRIAEASGVAIDLDPEALRPFAAPLLEAAQLLQADPLSWVLGGGEDHGLLATFGRTVTLPNGFTAIGSVLAGTPRVTYGSQAPASSGWDHFAH